MALIEDAAGALGAGVATGRAAASARSAASRFHPRKIVTTGEGGAVTTDDAALADDVRRLRNHGWTRGLADVPAPGLNYRLSDILCAVGIPQLRRLEELLAARDAHRGRLRRAAAGLPVRSRRPTRATGTAGRRT